MVEKILVVRWICIIQLLVLIGHLYLGSVWFGVAQSTDTKTHAFQRDWIVCSKHDVNSKLISQQTGGGWRDIYNNPLTRTQIFTLIMNKIYILAPVESTF